MIHFIHQNSHFYEIQNKIHKKYRYTIQIDYNLKY